MFKFIFSSPNLHAKVVRIRKEKCEIILLFLSKTWLKLYLSHFKVKKKQRQKEFSASLKIKVTLVQASINAIKNYAVAICLQMTFRRNKSVSRSNVGRE